MNRREIAISIITTMVVITIFASTASAITVDGYEVAGEWDGALCVDDPGGDMYNSTGVQIDFDSGYDAEKFCMRYDSGNDTLYFKFNTNGTAGDTDGDGNPSATSSSITDNFEVGSGEQYIAYIDVDDDGTIDYMLQYDNNIVTMTDAITSAVIPGTTGGSIGSSPYTDTVVEMSFAPAHNMVGFGECGATNLSVSGYIGNVHDGYGEDDTGDLVNSPPVSVLSGNDVCYCTYTNFSSSGSYDPDGSIVSYEWDFGDGNSNTTENPTYHYGVAGTYTVNLTVTDDFGFKCSNTTTVHVYANPTADFTATAVYWCDNTTFNDTSYGGTPPYLYAWDLGDGNTSTEQNVSHHYAAAGEYTVCLNITDYKNCIDGICKNITVNRRPPVPNATFRGVGCLEVELNASGSYDPEGTITQYEWDIDNNGVYEYDGGANPLYNVTFTEAQCGPSRTIGLRVTNDGGINNSTTVDIDVDCPPTAVCAANRTSVNDTTGGWVLFDGSGSYDPEGYSLNYTWVIHGATFHTPTVTYYVINETTAYLTVRDEYGCEDTCDVTVIASPGKGEPHADANGPYKTCVGYSITFDASGSWCSGCNIDHYEWDYYNNGTYIEAPGPIHEYTYPGEYRGIVRLRVTVDACNNTDTDTAFVIVEPCDPAAVPIMTPLGVLALIGMLCIAGVGRVMKRSRRL